MCPFIPPRSSLVELNPHVLVVQNCLSALCLYGLPLGLGQPRHTSTEVQEDTLEM